MRSDQIEFAMILDPAYYTKNSWLHMILCKDGMDLRLSINSIKF